MNKIDGQLVYCKDCNSRNTWMRNEQGDWHDTNGKVVEYSYKCSKCGHRTLLPYEVNPS